MPAVTRVLARKAGYELTRLPALEVKGQIAEQLRIVFKESGDVIVSGVDALEDNHISEEEAVSLHAETCEAIAALVHLRLLIEQRRPRLLNINIKDVLAG